MGMLDFLSGLVGGDDDDETADDGKGGSTSDAAPAYDVDELRERADKLVDEAPLNLDYSVGSLDRLDDGVGGRGGNTEATLACGGYFGEVLVRQFDGEWVYDDGWAVAVDHGGETTTIPVIAAAERTLSGDPVFGEIVHLLDADDEADGQAPEDDTSESELVGDSADGETDASTPAARADDGAATTTDSAAADAGESQADEAGELMRVESETDTDSVADDTADADSSEETDSGAEAEVDSGSDELDLEAAEPDEEAPVEAQAGQDEQPSADASGEPDAAATTDEPTDDDEELAELDMSPAAGDATASDDEPVDSDTGAATDVESAADGEQAAPAESDDEPASEGVDTTGSEQTSGAADSDESDESVDPSESNGETPTSADEDAAAAEDDPLDKPTEVIGSRPDRSEFIPTEGDSESETDEDQPSAESEPAPPSADTTEGDTDDAQSPESAAEEPEGDSESPTADGEDEPEPRTVDPDVYPEMVDVSPEEKTVAAAVAVSDSDDGPAETAEDESSGDQTAAEADKSEVAASPEEGGEPDHSVESEPLEETDEADESEESDGSDDGATVRAESAPTDVEDEPAEAEEPAEDGDTRAEPTETADNQSDGDGDTSTEDDRPRETPDRPAVEDLDDEPAAALDDEPPEEGESVFDDADAATSQVQDDESAETDTTEADEAEDEQPDTSTATPGDDEAGEDEMEQPAADDDERSAPEPVTATDPLDRLDELSGTPASLVELDGLIADLREQDDAADTDDDGAAVSRVATYYGGVLRDHLGGELKGEAGATGVSASVVILERESGEPLVVDCERVVRASLSGMRFGIHFDGLASLLDRDVTATGRPVEVVHTGVLANRIAAADSADAITGLVADADALAAEWAEADLDYSPGSLARLDDRLATDPHATAIPGVTLGTDADAELPLVTRTVADAAAYVAVVLVRHLDGVWQPRDGIAVHLAGRDGSATVDALDAVTDAVRGTDTVTGRYRAMQTILGTDGPDVDESDDH